MAFDAHQDRGFEVGDDDDLFADKRGDIFDFFADAGDDGALLESEVDGEFEQLFAFRDAFSVKDFGDA